MTNDEADDRYGSVNIAKIELLVTLGWSKIIGRYNTPDTTVDIRPRKSHEINSFNYF